MRNITIIDYGCGNVLSLHRAIEEIGFKSLVTKEKSEISKFYSNRTFKIKKLTLP